MLMVASHQVRGGESEPPRLPLWARSTQLRFEEFLEATQKMGHENSFKTRARQIVGLLLT